MAWIKVDQTLFDHRKITRLATMLDVDEMQAVGHVVSLWAWAIDNAQDGILSTKTKTGLIPFDDRQLAKAARWRGQMNDSKFVDCLVFSGFIDDDFDGHRTLHDWDEWAGALVKKRNDDRTRMQNLRKEAAERKSRGVFGKPPPREYR